MGVIAETADRVAVMYAGRIVEVGPVADVIHRPQHPYTRGLMGSIPTIAADRQRLHVAGANRSVLVQEPTLHHRDVPYQRSLFEHQRVQPAKGVLPVGVGEARAVGAVQQPADLTQLGGAQLGGMAGTQLGLHPTTLSGLPEILHGTLRQPG